MNARIEICGGIASGKTTLAGILGEFVIYEDFKRNPYWSLFYRDPIRFAFETEVSFLLQHYSFIREGRKRARVVVFDFSPIQDIAYAEINLSSGRWLAFKSLYDQIMREIAEPEVLVHLVCGPEEELARIRRRGRAPEAAIQLDYLERLNESISRRVSDVSPRVHVLTINSEENDFANDRRVQSCFRERILDAVRTSD